MDRKTILCVVGARPNFMKIAPVLKALGSEEFLRAHLVHTGQHYDAEMSQSFFEQLGIPAPDVNLEVGAGSQTAQAAQIMLRVEPVIERLRPACLLVVGDVTSTVACALTAVRHGVPVAHVEAGLRSFDRSMPEEINRVLTDQLSDLLFTTERAALDNLLREGISADRVHFVGNVMIDTLRANLPQALPPAVTLAAAGQDAAILDDAEGYVLVTLHRPSNVDDPEVLAGLLDGIRRVSAWCPVLFPVHPRTRERLERFGLLPLLEGHRIRLLPPAGYFAMLGLMRDARAVATDSGGVQEETTALGVPCFTLRENTERPITVTEGTNTLVGTDPEMLVSAFRELLAGRGKAGRVPDFWDGHAAERIARILAEKVAVKV